MTPKEKAEELVKRMYEYTGWLAETKEGFDKQDVQCALICVEEILKAREAGTTGVVLDKEYWEEVKEEITRL